ncbi:Mycolic acid cyclopropane synthetase-domain-containing protein [Globomyces pollinis-pini]|nr:Mycolic acid cyclopropane synthetase-domain-containing protein [Globomyces pollinis-pini]
MNQIINYEQNGLLTVMSHVSKNSWSISMGVAQVGVLRVLERIKIGRLTIYQDDHIYEFGDHDSMLHATINVLDPSFWFRILINGSMGLGESYIYEDIKVDHLDLLLMIVLKNQGELEQATSILTKQISNVSEMIQSNFLCKYFINYFGNPIENELGTDMMESFLDPLKLYSCPIWEHDSDTLQIAQMRNIQTIFEKCHILKSHHILDIGVGWGTLAIEAVKRFGCRVTSVAFSPEEQLIAEQRISQAKLEKHIKVVYQDVLSLNPKYYQFDRIIMIEKLSLFPLTQLSTFWKLCDDLLKPDGIMFIQAITQPEFKNSNSKDKPNFIKKYIYPNHHAHTFTQISSTLQTTVQGRLMIDQMLNIGPHYPRTFRLWRNSFVESFDAVAFNAKLPAIYTSQYKHKWDYYFAYAEVCFANQYLNCLQIRLTRPYNSILTSGIPN